MVEITRFFWKKAFTSDAVLLGEIESAEVDTSNWQITSLYVALTDEATKHWVLKDHSSEKSPFAFQCPPLKQFRTVHS